MVASGATTGAVIPAFFDWIATGNDLIRSLAPRAGGVGESIFDLHRAQSGWQPGGVW